MTRIDNADLMTELNEVRDEATRAHGERETLWDQLEDMCGLGGGADKRWSQLSVRAIGEYVLVDDGEDRWVAGLDEYREAVGRVAQRIAEGDIRMEQDEDGETGPSYPLYQALCDTCSATYSRCGAAAEFFGPQAAEFLATVEDEDVRAELAEELGVDPKEAVRG